jgi:hypothetical protein
MKNRRIATNFAVFPSVTPPNFFARKRRTHGGGIRFPTDGKNPNPRARRFISWTTKSGGYSDALGWTGDPKDKPTPHPPKAGELEHLRRKALHVYQRNGNCLPTTQQKSSARPHHFRCRDQGKCQHRRALAPPRCGTTSGRRTTSFRKCFATVTSSEGQLWAKSADKERQMRPPCGFRHELASALAWLLEGPANGPTNAISSPTSSLRTWQSPPLHPLAAGRNRQ